ncbi:MAG: glycosyltransferase family 2 protein [Polyangiaceae bacterium]
MAEPVVSVVIPIHNEEAILYAAVLELRENLRDLGFEFEIILAENGSRDGTLRVIDKLRGKVPELVAFSVAEPNYGAALRAGIERARGQFVLAEEIDLCDADFHARALAILQRENIDIVIGSKLLEGADDARPVVRHAASLFYSFLLRTTLGFKGTDTHGLKAMRRASVLPIVRACVVDRDVFASELVIRAERAGLSIREIPVRVMEKRAPTINLVRRVPSVVSRLVRLRRALGVPNQGASRGTTSSPPDADAR